MTRGTDWDLFWRYERLHRRHEPVDFRRWKRASQRALRAMYPGERVRVLDATSGLGDHTVNLAEEGFVVEAADASAEARSATREALDRAGLGDVPVHATRWEALGDEHAGRFDLVWNDAIHWVEEPGALHAALAGTRGCLAAGGALVFFFADPAKAHEGAGAEILAWDREHLAAYELGWSHVEPSGARVTLTRARSFADSHIDEHHVYVTHDAAGRASVEGTTLRRIYRWDWYAMTRALARAGYGEVTGHRLENDKGHTFSMCLARR